MTMILDPAQLEPLGRVRTARKAWRCRCADPVVRWLVRRTCEHGWTEHTHYSEAEAEADAARWRGKSCHGSEVPAVEDVTITAVPNSNFRPGCLVNIAPGDTYFEYLGESAMWESGIRYCASCAAAVWGSEQS